MTETPKRLTIHMGGPKCGSTAVQRHLNLNSDNFARNCVLVPGQGLDPGHPRKGGQSIVFQRAFRHQNKERFIFDKLRHLRDFMQANGFTQLVISAEILANHWNGLAECFARAAELFECRVVMYVRRQDDYIASGWKQWGLKEFDSPQAWIEHCLSMEMGDWFKRLQPWAELFGREQMLVRVYQRDKLKNGDVVQDFAELTGLDFVDCEIAPAPVNPSVGDALARLAHRARDLFRDRHDPGVYQVLGPLIGAAAYEGHSPNAFVTRAQRLHILAHYEASNHRLRQAYFPNLEADEPLFSPSIPEDEPQDRFEQLREENALLLRALWRLASGDP